MSGRIRTIKPEILDDEKTAHLDHLSWRIFVSVWVLADDYGNLRGDPDYIRGQALWASRESRESVAKALGRLASASLLSPYTIRGQQYLHVTGWLKHQKVDKPGKPRMPGPAIANSAPCEDSRDPREDSRDSRETLAPDLRPPTSDLRPPIACPEVSSPSARGARKPRPGKPETELAADWQPNAKAHDLAMTQRLNMETEAELFRAHAETHGRVAKDWDAAFRTWLLKAPTFKPKRNAPASKTAIRKVADLGAEIAKTDRHRNNGHDLADQLPLDALDLEAHQNTAPR